MIVVQNDSTLTYDDSVTFRGARPAAVTPGYMRMHYNVYLITVYSVVIF